MSSSMKLVPMTETAVAPYTVPAVGSRLVTVTCSCDPLSFRECGNSVRGADLLLPAVETAPSARNDGPAPIASPFNRAVDPTLSPTLEATELAHCSGPEPVVRKCTTARSTANTALPEQRPCLRLACRRLFVFTLSQGHDPATHGNPICRNPRCPICSPARGDGKAVRRLATE